MKQVLHQTSSAVARLGRMLLSRSGLRNVTPEIYAVASHWGTAIAYDFERRRFGHEAGAGNTRLVRFASDLNFLVAFAGEPGAVRFHAMPLWIEGLPGAEDVRYLRPPFTNIFLSAEQATVPDAPGVLANNRIAPDLWEAFRLSRVEMPAALAEWPLLRPLAGLAAERPSLDLILRRLGRTNCSALEAEALRAYLSSLRLDLGALAQGLAAQPAAARRLETLGDPWMSVPGEIARWEADREAGSRLKVVGTDLDPIADPDDFPITLGRNCVRVLRERVAPRRRACIVASARNEGPYLLEWAAYHRAAGFDQIFLYSNSNDDRSDELLAALARQGIVTWIDNRVAGAPPQMKSYSHALSMMPEVLDYEWSLVIDIDEFFVFDTARFRGVSDYLDWHMQEPADAIALNWLLFGTSEVTRAEPSVPVTRRFTKRHAWPDPHIKTMFKPHFFDNSHCHYPVGSSGRRVFFRDSDRRPYENRDVFPHAKEPVANAAWVNHYHSKSLEEVLWKCSRNLGDRSVTALRPAAEVAVDAFYRGIESERNIPIVEDRRAMLCSPRLEEEMAALLAVPEIRAANAAVVAEFSRRLAAIRGEVLSEGSVTEDPRIVELATALAA